MEEEDGGGVRKRGRDQKGRARMAKEVSKDGSLDLGMGPCLGPGG